MRMEEDQVKEYCKRTGQMDKLEKLAPRKDPKKEYPRYTVKEHKPTKYGNIPTEVNGILFDSKKEANYYVQMLMLQRCGVVKMIELQPVFELQPTFKKNGVTYRSIKYVADFRITYADGHKELVDTKSEATKTKDFKIKQKLFEYKYPDLTLILV